MNKFILPINRYPLIRGYQHHAYPLGIMFAENNMFLSWFYNNYIQLIYSPEDTCYFNFLYNSFYNNPCLDVTVIKKEELLPNKKNLTEYFVQKLSQGNYIFTSADEFYIPRRVSYKNQHFPHEIMIVGFDLEKQVYYVIGYDEKWDYTVTEVDISKFEEAFWVIGDVGWDVLLVKRNENKIPVDYNLDLIQIAKLIDDYVNSRNTVYTIATLDRLAPTRCAITSFGVNACYEFNNYLNKIIQENQDFDIRPFHIYWEHKKCMLMRMDYIYKNTGLSEINNLYEDYTLIEQRSLHLRNRLLKYRITFNSNFIKRSFDEIKSITTEESHILLRFSKLLLESL